MSSEIDLINRELELENQLLKKRMKKHSGTIRNLKNDIEALQSEKNSKQKEVDELNKELLSIKSGRAYKFAQKVKKIIKA